MTQPDDITCGPTSLHAVYRFFGENTPLEQIIHEVHALEDGGTLAVLLGQHALSRGYRTTLYSFNLKVIDLTWDYRKPEKVLERLKAQLQYKKDQKLRQAIKAYIGYIEAGGELQPGLLTRDFFAGHFQRNVPVLAGLSSTFLYQTAREYSDEAGKSIYDDLKGTPMGHFVVLSGFDKEGKIRVSDPYNDNPFSGKYYSVSFNRVVHSILLGIVTYDANVLVIERPAQKEHA